MTEIKSVLIVDDNEADHIIAKFAISEYNDDIEITSAYDGEEALSLLENLDHLPDIIFLDINMPGMDGHEFLRLYSSRPSHKAHIAMLSSSNQYTDREKCLNYDFVREYVVKPLETRHIQSIADRLS